MNNPFNRFERKVVEFEGKQYKGCPHCKGKGWKRGYDHVQGGVCFQCDGEGSKQIYAIKEERRKAKQKIKHIDDLKQELARIYKLMNDGSKLHSLPAYQDNKRKEANRVWAVLKDYGETITLEEIKERADKI